MSEGMQATRPCKHDKRYLAGHVYGPVYCLMCRALATKSENAKLKETLRHIRACEFTTNDLHDFVDSVLQQCAEGGEAADIADSRPAEAANHSRSDDAPNTED